MSNIKRFKDFIKEEITITSSPTPAVAPKVKPSGPAIKPSTSPSRPSPIRRDKPMVKPDPKAKIKKSTFKDVLDRYERIVMKKK